MGLRLADVELAVIAPFRSPPGPETIHRSHRLGCPECGCCRKPSNPVSGGASQLQKSRVFAAPTAPWFDPSRPAAVSSASTRWRCACAIQLARSPRLGDRDYAPCVPPKFRTAPLRITRVSGRSRSTREWSAARHLLRRIAAITLASTCRSSTSLVLRAGRKALVGPSWVCSAADEEGLAPHHPALGRQRKHHRHRPAPPRLIACEPWIRVAARSRSRRIAAVSRNRVFGGGLRIWRSRSACTAPAPI